MNIIDKIILAIYSLCLSILSAILVMFSFGKFEFLSENNVYRYISTIKGNYIYSIVGLVFLLISIRFLVMSLRGNRFNNKESYIVRHTNFGELKISTYTVEGLVQSVANRFTGIKNVKTRVNILEGILTIIIRGEVTPEINIPEVTTQLQEKVKEHIEKCTGIEVNEVKVEIASVTAPARIVK